MSAGSVCDELYEDKAIKRVGRVDLGSLTYTKITTRNGALNIYRTDNLGYLIGGPLINNNIWYGYANWKCSIFNQSYIMAFEDTKINYALINAGGYASIFGTLDSYTNINDFKQAMSGTYLYYELKNPITYTLDNPLDLSYKVDDFGTESILGANVSTINTTKFNGNIKYALNAADTIRNLQTNYVSTYENQGLDEERKFNARKNIGVDGIVDKADKSGIYPDLVAGNLVDEKNTGSSQVIMGLRTSCGTDSIVDDGYAQIKRIKGNSIVWNQRCSTYNINSALLSKDTTITTEQRYIVKNTVLSTNRCITFSGSSTNGPAKLYIKMDIKSNFSSRPYLRYPNYLSSQYGDAYISNYIQNSWCKIKEIVTDGIHFSGATGILPAANDYIKDEYISFKNVKNPLTIFNLTQMFGSGNEPSTVAEFDTLFPLSYLKRKILN